MINKDAILIYIIYTIAFKNKNIICISTQDLFALIQIAKCKRGLKLVSLLVFKLNVILEILSISKAFCYIIIVLPPLKVSFNLIKPTLVAL